jgi:hypothetical protein
VGAHPTFLVRLKHVLLSPPALGCASPLGALLFVELGRIE